MMRLQVNALFIFISSNHVFNTVLVSKTVLATNLERRYVPEDVLDAGSPSLLCLPRQRQIAGVKRALSHLLGAIIVRKWVKKITSWG